MPMDEEQHSDSHAARDFLSVVKSVLVFALAVLLCALAWWLPAKKPTSGPFSADIFALRRYTYCEFLIALIATGLSISISLAIAGPKVRRKRAIFRIVAVWIGVCVAVSLGELAAVVLPPRNNPFYTFNEGGVASDSVADPGLPYVRHAHMHWEGWSHGDIPEWLPDPYARRLTFQTDWQGFRNPSDMRKVDLVFIGDSFTEGGNVAEEETFVRLTGEQLGRSARNLGLFGYAPQAELVVLREFGIPCNPQVVVWQLCEGNDLSDALLYEQQRYQWEHNGRRGRISAAGFRHSAWSQRSPTFALFALFVPRERFWLEGTFRDAKGEGHPIRFSYWPSPQMHFSLGHPQAPWGNQVHPGWQPLVQCLRDGKQLLDENNMRLVLLFIPMKVTVMGDAVEFDEWSQKRLPPDWQIPEKVSLDAQLRRLCKTLEIPFVDATQPLTTAAQKGELVFQPFDTHISPRGHEIVSDLLVEQLADMLE